MEITNDGKLKIEPGHWEMTLKASLEFFNVNAPIVLQQAKEQWEKDGKDVALYYWTFRDDDRQRFLCTLVCFSDAEGIDQLVMKAPPDEVEQAYAWVIKNNPHLYFMGEPKLGWVNEDFMNNLVTVVDRFKVR